MRDVLTMIWKEISEFIGNQRGLRVFAVAVLIMGVIPEIHGRHGVNATAAALHTVVDVLYVLFATTIVVANTAPDLVLHERVGRTLDYLLATRLPDSAIFLGKVVTSAIAGYAAALVAIVVQLVLHALLSGQGWSWLYLTDPAARILAFGMPAALAVYVAVVGTFVALRVGDQRSAYLVTVLSIGVVIAPFLLGWLQIETTALWVAHATEIFGAIAVLLALCGLLLFRREMVVLYLQE